MIKVTFSGGHYDVEYVGERKDKERYRRKKGKSLLLIPSDYTVIDIETTGHYASADSIIEVCCIKYRNNNEIERFASLVQPPPYDEIFGGENGDSELEYVNGVAYVDSFITDLTGITNQMLSTAPKFNEISEKLWNFIKGEILVGHNVNFDINFLYDNFIALNENHIMRNDYVDTLRLARKALPELEHHRLEDLDKYFDINSNHHRSVDDCLTTNTVFHCLADTISKNNICLESKGYQVDNIDLRYIRSETDNFDINHPLYDKYCVFTGKLEQFSRKDAAQIVVNLGGHCENNVTKKTNFLIVGDFDYSLGVKDGKSTKMKKAEQLILKGQDLQILTESIFCDMLFDSVE